MSSDIPSIIFEFFDGSEIPLTLSDPRLPDEPLILANKPFYDMTGYSAAEALGSNCRFMQGKNTQKIARNTIRGDFAANRDSKVLIRNYRKSGEEFDNFLYVFTLMDDTDVPLFRIGSQFEVPAQNRAKAFEAHAKKLLAGIDKVNSSGQIARHQLIETAEVMGASVKSLLMARLTNLRAG